jgi:hypothetical protein
MTPTRTIANRFIAAAFAAFMLVAVGTPIASAGDDDDDDRRGRHHDKYDRDRKHGRGKGCWRPGRHYDPYWGRGGRSCRRPKYHPCRRPRHDD